MQSVWDNIGVIGGGYWRSFTHTNAHIYSYNHLNQVCCKSDCSYLKKGCLSPGDLRSHLVIVVAWRLRVLNAEPLSLTEQPMICFSQTEVALVSLSHDKNQSEGRYET